MEQTKMNITGILIALAFLVGAITKVLIPYYNKWRLDGRPFNWHYIRPIIIAVITVIPAILADFLLFTPALTVDMTIIIILAFFAGWGESDGAKAFLEWRGLIDKVLNKIGEY